MVATAPLPPGAGSSSTKSHGSRGGLQPEMWRRTRDRGRDREHRCESRRAAMRSAGRRDAIAVAGGRGARVWAAGCAPPRGDAQAAGMALNVILPQSPTRAPVTMAHHATLRRTPVPQHAEWLSGGTSARGVAPLRPIEEGHVAVDGTERRVGEHCFDNAAGLDTAGWVATAAAEQSTATNNHHQSKRKWRTTAAGTIRLVRGSPLPTRSHPHRVGGFGRISSPWSRRRHHK